jgi:hypothetical protein
LKEGLPKLAGEFGISVGDNRLGKAVESKDVIEEQLGSVWG